MSGLKQYTIKGIDAETVVLLQTAARVRGMKIVDWASRALREAAITDLEKMRARDTQEAERIRKLLERDQ